MGSVAENQRTCMTCVYVGWRHGQGGGGVIPCTISGRDILDHYRANACPKGFFKGGAPAVPAPDLRATEGPKRWAEYGRRALAWDGSDPEAFAAYRRGLAKGMGCSCNGDWQKRCKAAPFTAMTAAEAFTLCVADHNHVNAKLGKRSDWTVEEARRIQMACRP